MTKPCYTHDCTRCVFLGQLPADPTHEGCAAAAVRQGDTLTVMVDAYYHPSEDGKHYSLIRRFGNNPEDYLSYPVTIDVKEIDRWSIFGPVLELALRHQESSQ